MVCLPDFYRGAGHALPVHGDDPARPVTVSGIPGSPAERNVVVAGACFL